MDNIASELLETAIIYAVNKHKNQKLKNGLPYITHPLHVMDNVKTTKQKIVAVLHDVLEDTDASYQELFFIFGAEISDCVNILTRNKTLEYAEYIKNIKTNHDATIVKIEDIKHNLDLTRNNRVIHSPDKLNKYLWALNYLMEG